MSPTGRKILSAGTDVAGILRYCFVSTLSFCTSFFALPQLRGVLIGWDARLIEALVQLVAIDPSVGGAVILPQQFVKCCGTCDLGRWEVFLSLGLDITCARLFW